MVDVEGGGAAAQYVTVDAGVLGVGWEGEVGEDRRTHLFRKAVLGKIP